jgi:hypothetical protein
MYLPNELSPESNLGRISLAIELSKLDKFSHRHKMWFLKNNEIVIESRKNITNSFQIKKRENSTSFSKKYNLSIGAIFRVLWILFSVLVFHGS